VLRRGPVARRRTPRALRPTAAALLAAASLWAAGAGAEPAPEAAPPVAPVGALADLGHRAEEVAVRLRHIDQSLEDEAELRALEAEIDGAARATVELWDETGRLLSEGARRLALDALASAWSTVRGGLEAQRRAVDQRVHRREVDLAALQKLHEAWSGGRALAREGDAPPAVIERAEATLAAIDAMIPRVEQRRARVLVLQDVVSRSLESCDDALARVREARRDAVERIFVEREAPLWSPDAAASAASPRARAADPFAELEAAVDGVRLYGRRHGASLGLSLAILIALWLLLRHERSRVERAAGGDPHLASAASALRTPFAAAFLLALVLTRPLRPGPPAGVQQLGFGFAMLAAILMLRPRLGRLLPAALALTLLFAIDLSSELLVLPVAAEQWLTIAVKGATAALLCWVAAHLGDASGHATWSERWQRAAPTLLRLLALGCLVSAVCAAIGYVDLADFLGGGALFLVYSAFAVLAFRVAADGLMAIALVRGPLAARLRSVARHRASVERRLSRLLDLLAIGFWIWLALFRFELVDPAHAALASAFEARVHLGGLELPVGKLLGFAAVVAGAWLLSRVIVSLLEEDVFSRMALPRGVPFALSSLTRYTLLVTGFLFALATLGLDLTHITVLVSAVGVGLGFGLQKVVANFVAGLLLLFERPLQVGDAVQLGQLVGEVERIGLRSSTLRTAEGAEVIVPNSRLVDEEITNWTLSDRKRRVDLDVAVAEHAEPEAIQALLIELARLDPRMCDEPEPEALVVRFTGDSTEFQLRFWTDDPNWMRVRSDVGRAVQQALRRRREGGA